MRRTGGQDEGQAVSREVGSFSDDETMADTDRTAPTGEGESMEIDAVQQLSRLTRGKNQKEPVKELSTVIAKLL